jgi:hypothetical protein
MKQFLLIVAVFFGLGISAQTITLKVVDAETKEPLLRSTIWVNNSTRKYTDVFGISHISLSFPADISISYIGYATQLLTLKKYNQDTLWVKLVRKKQELTEVEVLPELPKYLFVGSAETQVVDYEWMDESIVVGVYNNKQRRCYVLVLNADHKIVDEQPLPADFERFYKSGIDRYYAVSGSAIHEIQLRRNILTLKNVNSDFFYDKVVYYKGYHNNYLYIQDTDKSKQAHLYYIERIDSGQSNIKLFTAIGNQHLYNAYKKDMQEEVLKRQADLRLLRETNNYVDGDGYYETETKGEFRRKEDLKNKYKEIHSQLFIVDSTVLIFDFTEDSLCAFSFDGKAQSKRVIHFHQKAGWLPMVQRADSVYYTSYLSGNYTLTIAPIRSDFMEMETGQQLQYPNASKWKVHNGFVYYLHAPVGYPFNVFLFREELK